MSLLPYALARPFLFGLDPETAHELTLHTLARVYALAARLARARHGWALAAPAERLVALAMMVMAIVLVLPIPFGNLLPALSLLRIPASGGNGGIGGAGAATDLPSRYSYVLRVKSKICARGLTSMAMSSRPSPLASPIPGGWCW